MTDEAFQEMVMKYIRVNNFVTDLRKQYDYAREQHESLTYPQTIQSLLELEPVESEAMKLYLHITSLAKSLAAREKERDELAKTLRHNLPYGVKYITDGWAISFAEDGAPQIEVVQ